MTSSSGNDGTVRDHRHLRHHAQPRHRRGRRAEPHLAGRGPAAERGEAGRHLGHQGLEQLRARRRRLRRERRVRHRCSSATTSTASSRRAEARARRRRRLRRSASGRYAMRLWLDPDRLAGRDITADEVVAALREQNVQVAAGAGRRRRRRAKGQTYQISVRAEGRLTEPAQFDDIILKRVDRRRAGPREGRRPHRARRRELLARRRATTAATRSASASCSCRPPTRCRSTATSTATLDRLSQRFPPGLKIEIAFDTTTRRLRVDPRSGDDAARGDRASSCSSCSCSSRTGGRR